MLRCPIPANFFWDISLRFLSWECWIISEDSRRSPNSSEEVWSLPKAKLSRKRLSTKSEIPRKVLSFIHFTHGFRSLHVSIRREKLARKREPAWNRSFQPEGVRFTPKAWELAGIVSPISNTMLKLQDTSIKFIIIINPLDWKWIALNRGWVIYWRETHHFRRRFASWDGGRR